jgi:TatD DNase family protein
VVASAQAVPYGAVMRLETPCLWDTHAHLDSPKFAQDLPQVIDRAKAAGVRQIVTLGTDFASSQRAIALSEEYPEVLAAVGWHPNDIAKAPEDIASPLIQLLKHDRVVAVGEIGLDYYRLPRSGNEAQEQSNLRIIAQQKRCFQRQLQLAADAGLNCVIHQRDAFEDAIELFQPFAGRIQAVFHCFTGDVTALRRVLDMDCLVSFTGVITYKGNPALQETLASCPADRFLLETDCPYLAPVPLRGKRCEPAMLRHTAEWAAQARGCATETIMNLTHATAEVFFSRRK